MEERHAQPHPGERVRAPTTKPGWEGKRPLLWRLPLLAFLVSGVVCLNYLDGRLSSDYRKSAADLAIQADAMHRFLGKRQRYSAAEVIAYLLS